MDILSYLVTKLQFRATQGPKSLTGWQGEIQGGLAAGGKISLGPFNMLLEHME